MDVRQEYLDKAKAELGDLAQAGVIMTGNAFSHVLLVKGEPEEAAADGSLTKLLEGPDGKALHAALGALGYAPEDWGGLSTNDAEGYPLVPGTLRLAVATFDPSTLIALDDAAAAAIREAFADELVELESLDASWACASLRSAGSRRACLIPRQSSSCGRASSSSRPRESPTSCLASSAASSAHRAARLRYA